MGALKSTTYCTTIGCSYSACSIVLFAATWKVAESVYSAIIVFDWGVMSWGAAVLFDVVSLAWIVWLNFISSALKDGLNSLSLFGIGTEYVCSATTVVSFFVTTGKATVVFFKG